MIRWWFKISYVLLFFSTIVWLMLMYLPRFGENFTVSDEIFDFFDNAVKVLSVLSLLLFVLSFKTFLKEKNDSLEGMKSDEIDESLAQVIKAFILNYLNSLQLGEIYSKKNLAEGVSVEMEKDLYHYRKFLNKNVSVEAKIMNVEDLRYKILKDSSENIKLKVFGLFKIRYFHDGKLLKNPEDVKSYLDDKMEVYFKKKAFVLNLRKLEGNYEVIGYKEGFREKRFGEV